LYEKAYGPIEKGYDVHHKDCNKENNSLENLALIYGKAHQHLHSAVLIPEERKQRRYKNMITKVHDAAKKWHGSDAGKEWHKKQYGTSLAAAQQIKHVCEECGSEFYNTRTKTARFCSNKCRTRSRFKSGVDDEERICLGCGKQFRINKYKKAKTCSLKCAWVVRKRENS
jgi:hypothetical protein